MKVIDLVRYKSSAQGTLGLLKVDDETYFYTLELPWKNNNTNVSCIPKGTYLFTPRYSQKYREHYLVNDVEGRTYILMHSGNVAGDLEQGYKTHSAGCILIGKYVGKLWGQDAVLGSRIALRKLNNKLEREKHILRITGVV